MALLLASNTRHPNASVYTLDTVAHVDSDTESHSDTAPLLAPSTPSYGTAITTPRPSSRKVIFNATLKMACIFTISTIFLGGVLWLALPTLEECVALIP